MPVKQRKLSKRTLVAAVLIVLSIPLTIFAGVMYLGNQHYNVTVILVLTQCMVPFFLVFESRKPKARELMTIAVLCAIGVAGRSAFFMLPQFTGEVIGVMVRCTPTEIGWDLLLLQAAFHMIGFWITVEWKDIEHFSLNAPDEMAPLSFPILYQKGITGTVVPYAVVVVDDYPLL